jgi:hypothetical protein
MKEIIKESTEEERRKGNVGKVRTNVKEEKYDITLAEFKEKGK